MRRVNEKKPLKFFLFNVEFSSGKLVLAVISNLPLT